MTETAARSATTDAVDAQTRRLSTEGVDLLLLAGVGDANLSELQRI